MKLIFSLFLTALLFSCASQKETVQFEKVIFHSSRCFGSCPVINLQINKDKSLLLSKMEDFRKRKAANTENYGATEEYEYFKGTVSDELYNELLIELAKTDNVSFQGQNCCDAPMKSIIAYYNGKRKHIETMFPPKEAENLIAVLYKISKSESLVKTTEKFEIEVDTTKAQD